MNTKTRTIVHVEDMNTHNRKAIGFTGNTAAELHTKVSAYFLDRPHLRIVCIDEN